MALGKSMDNNPQQRRSPVVFSGYSMSNTFSKVDQCKLRPSFWNQMLKLEFIPAIPAADGKVNWDYKAATAAYITHTKAYILANEIRLFKEDPETYNSSGILSGETLLTISNGQEFGEQGVFLVARKVDKTTGQALSTYSYEFNIQYYNSIRGYDASSASFDTDYDSYKWLEVDQFLQVLDSYVEAMTYATAYAVTDATSYRHDVMVENLGLIATSLGVDVSRSGQNSGISGKNSKSVFNQRGNNGGSSSFNGMPKPVSPTEHTTIEAIEGDLFD